MKRFKKILYVADPVVEQGEAFERAVTLAEKNDARLTIAEVFESIPSFITRQTPHNLRKLVHEHRKSELTKLCRSVRSRIKIEAEIYEGTFFLEVVRDVLRAGRDLVVKPIGGQGSGLGRLIGSNDMHLLRKCPCPVWLIKLPEDRSYRSILAAVDFDDADESDVTGPLNRQILELSLSLANSERSELHICHAWKLPYEDLLRNQAGMPDEEVDAYVDEVESDHQHRLESLTSQAKEWAGHEVYEAVRPKTHLERGYPQRVIPSLAQTLNADLVVMGTVGRVGISGLFIGNTAESVADQLACSLLAVKPPGYVSPVKLEE